MVSNITLYRYDVKTLLNQPSSALRMSYWKQWRKPRRRIRELIKLGVSKREAKRESFPLCSILSLG